MQIQAERTTLNALLGVPDRQLRIPPYQRPYAWDEEQVDELWADITNATGRAHFMGSLVLTGEDPRVLDVIDGQQRLTTLLLLLGLIRDRWKAQKAEYVGRVQRFLTDEYAVGDQRFRLRSGDANWPVFRRYVLAELGSPERREWSGFAQAEDARVRSRNGALVANASRLAAKLDLWLAHVPDAERTMRLDGLERTVLGGLEFVKIHVAKVADAFVIFETLNDRGLALSAGDLLKNHLLQRGARDGLDLEEMADRWDDLLAYLGGGDVTRFLRHYLLVRHARVQKDGVFDLFKDDVQARGARSLLDELLSMSRWYGQFVDPSKAEHQETRAVLADLDTLRAVMCYTPLLAARRFAMSEDDFVRLAQLAETLTFRYSTIGGKDSKELERVYHRAAKALWESEGKDIAGARKILIESMPGHDEFVAAFRHQVMGRKYVIDYVLRKIEASLDTEEKMPHGTSVVHIEHILPQSLSDEWKVVLGPRVPEHASYVDRWGNLTLLGGRKNIKASNGAFSKKRIIYSDSAIKLTKLLAERVDWNLDAIDARQVELANLADAVWAVPAA
jgi:hypothetical protein